MNSRDIDFTRILYLVENEVEKNEPGMKKIAQELFIKCSVLYNASKEDTNEFKNTLEELTKLLYYCKILEYKISDYLLIFENAILRLEDSMEVEVKVVLTENLKSCLKSRDNYRKLGRVLFNDDMKLSM